MRKLNLYISEKLKLNKDTKAELIPEQIIQICGFERGKEDNVIDIINKWVSDNKIEEIKVYMDQKIYSKLLNNLKGQEISSYNNAFYKKLQNDLFIQQDRHLLLNNDDATILATKKWIAIGNITKFKVEQPVLFIERELAEKEERFN